MKTLAIRLPLALAVSLALGITVVTVAPARTGTQPVASAASSRPLAGAAASARSFMARAAVRTARGHTRLSFRAWSAAGRPLSGVRVGVVRRSGHRKVGIACARTNRAGRSHCRFRRPRGSRLAIYGRSRSGARMRVRALRVR